MRRTLRGHQLLYTLRVFSRPEETWDIGWWRPQHIVLKQEARFPGQLFLQAVDTESWMRYNRLNDRPPQLTLAVPLQGAPPKVPFKTMPRPPPAASGAGSCTDPIWRQQGSLPKAQASPLWLMRLQCKGPQPFTPVDSWMPGTAARDRSRSPRGWRSTATEAGSSVGSMSQLSINWVPENSWVSKEILQRAAQELAEAMDVAISDGEDLRA